MKPETALVPSGHVAELVARGEVAAHKCDAVLRILAAAKPTRRT
jgi:hypothetical protein